jgi:DNA topoisomerase-1
VLRDFWADFKPRTEDVMGQKPWDVEKALDEYLAPHLFPPKPDGTDPRACPSCGNGHLALKVGKFGPFISCSNYPECRFTRQFSGATGDDTGPQNLGNDPATGLPVEVKSGRFGRYVQSGDKRTTIPKDIDNLDLEMALKLIGLPREVGLHPETGLPIVANLGRYGPYLLHDGKYANLKETAELFEIGMNAAVVKLAEPKGGRGRTPAEPLAVLGAHPESGAEVKVLNGRFGPYITDGSVNANVPKGTEPTAVTLAQAVELLAERAARGPAKGKRKTAAKKAPAKKPAAKKPAAKKAPAKKAATKKASA